MPRLSLLRFLVIVGAFGLGAQAVVPGLAFARAGAPVRPASPGGLAKALPPPPLAPPAHPPPPAPPPGPRHFTPAELVQMRAFCRTYHPPDRPARVLPSGLRTDPARLVLRPLFVKWARTYRVPPELAEAVAWQESGWRNDVVSPANAHGIGQLLPQTAAFLNRLLGTNLQLTVAEDNIRMEIRFLAQLLQGTGGQVCSAVASYYEGLGTFRHIGVLPESQVYVERVLSLRPRFR